MASDLLLVSDFDGTLVNTEAAVREAYGRARGEPFTDEDWSKIWGRSWEEWCSETVKKRKDEIYKESLVRHASVTSFGMTTSWRDFLILTGASRHSVLLCLQLFFGSVDMNLSVLAYEASSGRRHSLLKSLRPACDGRSFYFDDDMFRGHEICRGTGFTFCHVAGSTVTVFNRKRNTSWIQLSSLLERMNVCEVSFLPTTSHSSS